jgi:transcriptional regulator with XRE-family HTH domain
MAEVNHVLKSFGGNIRRLRLKLKLTQEGLAEVAGLHPTYISGIERGIRNTTIISATSLAKALGCTLSQLCTSCARPISSINGIKKRRRARQ